MDIKTGPDSEAEKSNFQPAGESNYLIQSRSQRFYLVDSKRDRW